MPEPEQDDYQWIIWLIQGESVGTSIDMDKQEEHGAVNRWIISRLTKLPDIKAFMGRQRELSNSDVFDVGKGFFICS